MKYTGGFKITTYNKKFFILLQEQNIQQIFQLHLWDDLFFFSEKDY